MFFGLFTVLVLTLSVVWHCSFRVQVCFGCPFSLMLLARGLLHSSHIFAFPSLFPLLGFVLLFCLLFLFFSRPRFFICFTLFYSFVVISAFPVYVLGHVSSVNCLHLCWYIYRAGKFLRFVAARPGRRHYVRVCCVLFFCFFGLVRYLWYEADALVCGLGKLFVAAPCPPPGWLAAVVLNLLESVAKMYHNGVDTL